VTAPRWRPGDVQFDTKLAADDVGWLVVGDQVGTASAVETSAASVYKLVANVERRLATSASKSGR
jgi:hypothetical protein